MSEKGPCHSGGYCGFFWFGSDVQLAIAEFFFSSAHKNLTKVLLELVRYEMS